MRPCKLCGKASKRLCELNNWASDTRVLTIYRCSGCAIVFVGNEVSPAELAQAYNRDFTEYYQTIEYENRQKMLHSISDIRGLVPADAYILDIGAGIGMFTQEFHKAGFSHLAAHEIPGTKLSHLEAIGCTVYQDFDYSTLPSNTFDMVTLLDVLEHVVDPQYLIDACFRVLKPGGVVYFHTPVVASMDRLMHTTLGVNGLGAVGRMWQYGRTNIFHLQNFTAVALNALLTKAGFADVNVQTRNELSWPLWAYIKLYMTDRMGLPAAVSRAAAKTLTPLFWPFLSTNLFNSNKGIAWARKPPV
ncbi:MAG: class I SAM-dependent methyltransferase [Stenotrophobium sp.]